LKRHLGFAFFSAAAALAFTATGLVATASAMPITSQGEVLNGSSGSGSYSWIHTPSNAGGSGSKRFGFDAGQSINFEWDNTGDLNGAIVRFGSAATTTIQGAPTFTLTDAGAGFTATLTLGIAGAGSNTLTFGDLKSNPRTVSTPDGDASITNELTSGQINFSLEGGGGTLAGTFNFGGIDASSHPFNGIGAIGATNGIAIALWGLSDPLGINDCIAGDCTGLFALTGTNSGVEGRFGVDLVFTGTPVPEPGALALFGVGLIGFVGLALTRRRRGVV